MQVSNIFKTFLEDQKISGSYFSHLVFLSPLQINFSNKLKIQTIEVFDTKISSNHSHSSNNKV